MNALTTIKKGEKKQINRKYSFLMWNMTKVRKKKYQKPFIFFFFKSDPLPSFNAQTKKDSFLFAEDQ
jgi:hypothetical protein